MMKGQGEEGMVERMNMNVVLASRNPLATLKEWLGPADADVDVVDGDGRSPLYRSARAGMMDCVLYLLERKASLNFADASGFVPLHACCYKGHADVARVLLHNKAMVNPTFKSALSPMNWAIAMGHRQCVQVLLEYGADFRDVNQPQPWVQELASAHSHYLIGKDMCRHACLAVLGCRRRRTRFASRDMMWLIARAVWSTRTSQEWQLGESILGGVARVEKASLLLAGLVLGSEEEDMTNDSSLEDLEESQ